MLSTAGTNLSIRPWAGLRLSIWVESHCRSPGLSWIERAADLQIVGVSLPTLESWAR